MEPKDIRESFVSVYAALPERLAAEEKCRKCGMRVHAPDRFCNAEDGDRG